jgi:regulator of sigma E protease
MISTTIITFISLVILIILHEFGHFLLAKRFGVKVEEFGIGYPPRLLGKKFGETIYSFNLLPFGAFVRLQGETERNDDPRSFSQQSVGKRILIAFGGVASFWVIAAILLSIVFTLGTPIAIEDGFDSDLINPQIQISTVAPNTPAEKAGLRMGDTIEKISFGEEEIIPTKIKEIQDFTNSHLDEDIILTIKRGKEVFETSLIPRSSYPEGQGPMGVALFMTAIQKYSWYLSPWYGILATGRITFYIARGYFQAIASFFQGEPTGVQLLGPVGVFQMLNQSQQLGVNYFLNFLVLISLNLAIFNILPIPAVDGGKILFLGIEAIRKKPVPENIERNLTAACFLALLLLMVWVTINDVSRLF